MPSFTARVFTGFILANCCSRAFLPAAEPDLKAIFPLGCTRGQSVEVSLIGSGLDQAESLYFAQRSTPDLSEEELQQTQPGLSFEHIEKNRFRVTASDNAPVGGYDIWIATPDGVAGPRRFQITSAPLTLEQEDNDTPDEAQTLTLPAVVDARLDKAADLDWFTFSGEKDQELRFTCRSPSLDGSVQPVVTLVSSDGRELLHASAARLEPAASFKLPAAGAYYLRVHERAYRKDDFSFYRLELNLPILDVDSNHRDGKLLEHYRLFGLSDCKELPGPRETPQAIPLPFRLVGSLDRRGEVDRFQFAALKDQTIHIEAFGERLGQLMDLEAAVYDNNDKEVAALKDTAPPKGLPAALSLGSLDPTSDWKVPADGDYTIAIRDLYGGSAFGPDRAYLLNVEQQLPRFRAFMMVAGSKPSRGLALKRGASGEVSVSVLRTGGFVGDVRVTLAKPLAGVTVEDCVLGAKETTKAFKLSATADATAGWQGLRLVAEADVGSDKRRVAVSTVVAIRPGLTRRVDNMMIYISE